MLYADRFADSHIHAYAPADITFRMFDKMAELGVTDAAMLAYTYIETGIDNNIVCLYYKEKYKKLRLRALGGLYYDAELNNSVVPYKEQAEMLLEMGCDGIKFLDMKPNYNLYCGLSMDDKAYDTMYDMLEERRVPLVTHVADPAVFWHKELMSPSAVARGWCFDDPKFLTQQQIFDCLLRRLDRNPNLKMSLAHFGFLSEKLDMCEEICEKYPNVYFDLAPGWEIFADFAKDAAAWHDFFTRHSDRIMYGTDSATGCSDAHIAALNQTMIETVSHDARELPIPHYPAAKMRGLYLDEAAQKRICYSNYFDFYGCEAKPVNISKLKEHAELILSIVRARGDTGMIKTAEHMLADI